MKANQNNGLVSVGHLMLNSSLHMYNSSSSKLIAWVFIPFLRILIRK